jgi:hypothetical protein
MSARLRIRKLSVMACQDLCSPAREFESHQLHLGVQRGRCAIKTYAWDDDTYQDTERPGRPKITFAWGLSSSHLQPPKGLNDG